MKLLDYAENVADATRLDLDRPRTIRQGVVTADERAEVAEAKEEARAALKA